MLGIKIAGPTRYLYTKLFEPELKVDKYDGLEASSVPYIVFQDILIATKRVGELSIFLYAPADANELYLEHCIECVTNAVYDVLGSYLTEENVIDEYLMFTATISEVLDDGYLLCSRAPKVFEENKKDGGMLSGLVSGAKLVAKTLLS